MAVALTMSVISSPAFKRHYDISPPEERCKWYSEMSDMLKVAPFKLLATVFDPECAIDIAGRYQCPIQYKFLPPGHGRHDASIRARQPSQGSAGNPFTLDDNDMDIQNEFQQGSSSGARRRR